MSKHKKIVVNGADINITSEGDKEYISLTDMVKNMEDGPKLIENWLRSKNTLEYLAAWESIHNGANFNSLEFGGIKIWGLIYIIHQSGLVSYVYKSRH